MSGRIEPPPSACHAEAAPRRARRRGRGTPCGRARSRSRRESPSSPAPGPALSRTSIGRRRLPPASSVEPGVGLERRAVPLQQTPQPFLDGLHSGRQPRARGVEHRVTGGGTAERFTPSLGSGPRGAPARIRAAQACLAPEWMAMIPPASRTYRIRSSPTAGHHLGEVRGRREAFHRLGQIGVCIAVADDRAQEGDESIEPQRVEDGERGAPRMGDLEDHQPAARLEHPRQLPEAAVQIRQVARPEADCDRVESPIRIRKLEGIRPLETHLAQAPLPGLAAGELEHRLGEVAADHLARAGQLAPRARAPGRRSRSRRRGRRHRGRARRGRRPARASGGASRLSSPCSSGRRRPRCGRTSSAPAWRTRAIRVPGSAAARLLEV